MPQKLFNVILAGLVVVLTAFNFYLYDRQQRSFGMGAIKGSGQKRVVEDLQVEIRSLRDELEAQRMVLVRQGTGLEEVRADVGKVTGLLPQIKSSIAEIKTVISQSRVESWKLKDDARDWQRDYVGTLVEIQKKVNELEGDLASVSEIVDQGFPKILQEIDSVKENIRGFDRKASPKTPVDGLQPLPRFDPRLL